ncbi:hypothetical protein Tco_0483659 [Tanacetum coccineum]
MICHRDEDMINELAEEYMSTYSMARGFNGSHKSTNEIIGSGSKVTAKQTDVTSPNATMSCNSTEDTGLQSNSTARMVGGAKIPQTRTSSGVRSIEAMDSAINNLTFKFASIFTVLEEIRSAIVGGGNQLNCEGPDEEGEETLDDFNRGPRGGNRPWVMTGWNINSHGYGEWQSYRVKAKIPNFVRNLDIEAVLDWLYEVDMFFDIMKVPKEEQQNVVSYKLHGGAGVWWQHEQDNRRAQGRRPVDTWMRMKQIIKGKRTVAHYTSEFLRLQSGFNLRETEEQSVVRYTIVAKFFKSREVELDVYLVCDQAQNMAMKLERMASKSELGLGV